MKRRSLFLALAIALVVGGFATLEARADSALLSTLIANGTAIQISTVQGCELQVVFTGYQQTTTNAPPSSSITIEWATGSGSPFTGPGGTTNYGFVVDGSFNTGPGVMMDAGLTYTVSAVNGGKIITDAYAFVDASQTGGTGMGAATDTLNLSGGVQTLVAQSSTPPLGTNPSELTFPGQSSIVVHKDIFSEGLTGTTLFSHIQQGYSCTAVPEPASMALLGIGMTGLLAFRRLFKKTRVS